ncbi:hypothetical protein [Nonomuraea sp. LPB2021202275-12-8]|uniref:hypothetical protein n=1 Tax=Nonomuraea sp. LPB2021202275-12-8 TaxID=3120159 RepID=UPI00300C73B5
MKKLVAEVSGVVEAPAAKVRAALARALLPGGRDVMGRFTVADMPGHTSTVEVTEDVIAIQGGWWYRGEWSLAPHPEGTLVVHRVYNVARWGRWGVGLANRFFVGFEDTTRGSFADGLARVGADLGCRTRLA